MEDEDYMDELYADCVEGAFDLAYEKKETPTS